MRRVFPLVGLAAVLAGLSPAAPAQSLTAPPSWGLTAGARLWHAEWTTFTYTGRGDGLLLQDNAAAETVTLPVLGARVGAFSASLSAYAPTRHRFPGTTGRREEWDLNLGYALLPGLTATLGYKRVLQTDGPYRYEPRGPVLGLGATAPLGNGWSVFGSLGIGRLKATGDPNNDKIVAFDSTYRLSEWGLAYALPAPAWTRALTLTGGYRMQAITSRDAQPGLDGRDLTEGPTLGLLLTF